MFDPHHLYFNKRKRSTKKGQIIQKRALPTVPMPLTRSQINTAVSILRSNGIDTIETPTTYTNTFSENVILTSQLVATVPFTVDLYAVYTSILKQNFQFIPEEVKSFNVSFELSHIQLLYNESATFHEFQIPGRTDLNTIIDGLQRDIYINNFNANLYQVVIPGVAYAGTYSYLEEGLSQFLQYYYTTNPADYNKWKTPNEETFPDVGLIRLTLSSSSAVTFKFQIRLSITYTY